MVMDSVATSARALFPKSAGVIKVGHAWRRADSTLDQPRENGPDGWSPVGRVASLAVLHELVDAGFSHVSLVPTGTRNRRSPVSIASLIK